MSRPDEDWEELGAREPYFAVLTDERFLQENLSPAALAAFQETGERDLEMLLELASKEGGDAARPVRALDFGCGVGRLTIPLARRCGHVVGVDCAGSMLSRARVAAAAAGLVNVEFRPVDSLGELESGTFDLVCSYIVLQHIPVRQGEEYLRALLDLTAVRGQAVLHVSFRRPGGAPRRLLRALRARFGLVNRLVRLARRERDLPYMQMNEYDSTRVTRMFEERGFRRPTVTATDHGGIAGGIFVSTKLRLLA